jgi:hypothetical protein
LDEDLTVGPDEAALIIAADGELRLVLPDHETNDDLHHLVALLALVATKFDDPRWVAEMLMEYEKLPDLPE